MGKIIENTPLKVVTFLLSFLMFFVMVASIVCCIVMFFNDFYTQDFATLEKRMMGEFAEDEMYKLISLYNYSDDALKKYYDDKNILYQIKNEYTGETLTNFIGQECITEYSKIKSTVRYEDIEKRDSFLIGESEIEDGSFDEKYVYDDGEKIYFTEEKITFRILIPREMKYTDRFFLLEKAITMGYNNRYTMIFVSILSLIGTFVVYSYMFISVGHKKGCDGIKVAMLNNIPIDIFSKFIFVFYILIKWLFGRQYDLIKTILMVAAISIIAYFILLWYLLSFVVQAKSKSLVKRTVTFWLVKKVKKIFNIIGYLYKKIATVYKVAIVLSALWTLLTVFILLNISESSFLVIGFVIISIIASVFIIIEAIAFQTVKQGTEKIVNGDLENKINTLYMFGDMKKFAQSLNNINQGLQTAIDDKMKSERFKTELITNVSHDIKTPLTSIINYIDLIKKENCENYKINEYIEVLDRQSFRLKKLIEDLIEASKASTGNIAVNLTKCNLSLLINQAIGEFTDKFENNKLQLVQTSIDDDVYVIADGRHLWRVFDNLLNNICKYALEGTRVYIDIMRDNDNVFIFFKNISKQPINLSSEELLERFVRGDKSRNTEGSGLGLSIAESLIKLQNGNFNILTDGDLFKVKITLELAK